MNKQISRLAAFVLAAAPADRGAAPPAPPPSSSAAQDMMSSESMAAGGAESALLPEDVSTAENAQKLIYNADLELETTGFDAAQDTLQAAVENTGAWLEYSEMNGSAEDQDRRLYYTVRVPVDNYRTFLEQAGQSGSVLSLNESAQDVTASYIDVGGADRLAGSPAGAAGRTGCPGRDHRRPAGDRKPAFRRAV